MESNGLSLKFQGITLSITTLIILLYTIGELRTFCSIDTPPKNYTHITDNQTQKEKTPVRVETGLTITDFSIFNMIEDKFSLSGVIWFRFDPKLISLDKISKFSFWRGHIDSLSEPLLSQENSKTLALYKLRLTFKTNLYYGFFPFEDHRIYLMLLNDHVDRERFEFVASRNDFIVADSVYISGWRYEDHTVTTGYVTTTISTPLERKDLTYPSVLFGIDFFYESARHLIGVILPLLIIFLIDLFSFCLDQRRDRSALVQISTGNVVAIIAYRFVIESLAPRVGYMMVADLLFFLFLTNTLCVFVINTVGPYLTIFQRKMISIGLQSLLLAGTTYIFTIWIPC